MESLQKVCVMAWARARRIEGVYDEPGLAVRDDLGRRAECAADHRLAAGHALDEGEIERIGVGGRRHHEVAGEVGQFHRRRGQPAEKAHPLRDTELVGLPGEFLPVGGIVAQKHGSRGRPARAPRRPPVGRRPCSRSAAPPAAR